jgi:collagenase-like PrtC family protease
MRLSLAPNPWFWPRERTLAFYRDVATWPVDIVHLGETVCSKRRELNTRDWIVVAESLAEAGKEVVLSTLALVEAESEVGAMRRLVGHGGFIIEANDLTAVQLCRQAGRPFVGGPGLNVYNHHSLKLLQEDGLVRWVPGTEQGELLVRELLEALEGDGGTRPELEVQVWGRQALSWSARCFTARALDVPKDACGFRCIEHPEGLPLATREGDPFLRINGVQVMGEEVVDLGPELGALRSLGVDILRLVPQPEGLEAVVQRFHDGLRTGVAPERVGAASGYWSGTAGSSRIGGT